MVFMTFECLRIALASKTAQLKVFGCKMFFWYVRLFLQATDLATNVLIKDLSVLLLSVMPVPPVPEQCLAGSHASNVLSKVPAREWQQWKILLRGDWEWTGWLLRRETRRENLADLENALCKFPPKLRRD